MTEHLLHENNEASLTLLRDSDVTAKCLLCRSDRGIIRLGQPYGDPPIYREAILSCGHGIELELTTAGIAIAAPYKQ